MLKILLVEDNETHRNMLSYRLKRKGYELVIAVDGNEAISVATAQQPDLILMDLDLPVMNGWDATQKIKANPNTKNIPVIALTAHAMSGDRQKALEAGCDDYETKPVDFPHLMEKIETWLKQNSTSPDKPTAKIDENQSQLQPQSPVVESSTQEQAQAPKTTKILLVEDNETNRNMLSYRLKRKGYELAIAVDGNEAVSAATAQHPDLILMDLSLPVMNGWDATQKIKANLDTKNIPVIALTAHAMSGDRQKALEAGCDDYETKPIDFPRLTKKIETWLKQDLTSPDKATAKIDENQSQLQSQSAAVESSTQEPVETPKTTVVSDTATKILLVEDNETNRNMISYRLKRKGYELVIAVDGNEAVLLAVAQQPDLILMDLNLPEKDGWQATREIRANPETQHIPIMALTANNTSSDRRKALEAGCNDYETKPINFIHLTDKINALLNSEFNSQFEKLTLEIDSIEAKAESALIAAEQLTQQQQIELIKQEQEGNLLPLTKEIKILYAPAGTRSWRTGSFVKLSDKMAEVSCFKEKAIPPTTSKIEIRIWQMESSAVDEKLYARVLGTLENENKNFTIAFYSQYTQIEELLSGAIR